MSSIPLPALGMSRPEPAETASPPLNSPVLRYVLGVTFFTALVAGGLIVNGPTPRSGVIMVWAAAALVSQLMIFPTSTRSGEISLGMSVHLAMILLLQPAEFLLALCLSRGAAHLFFRRTIWYKAVFNIAQIALSVLIGYIVFHSIVGAHQFEATPESLFNAGPGYLGGALAYYLVNMALVCGVISLSTRQPVWKVWRDNYGYLAEIVATTGLVLLSPVVAMTSQVLGPAGLMAFIVPIVFVRDASTRYIALRRAQEALVQSERQAAKGEIATEVGHAIIEHLTALQGHLQLLMMKTEAGTHQDMRGRLVAAMDKLDDISTLSRSLVDYACGDVHLIPTRLNNLVRNGIDALRNQKRLDDVHISLDMDARVGHVTIDPARIQQVVTTLVLNAAAAMKQAESPRRMIRVSVRLREGDGRIEIGISDSGPHVEARRLFEPDFTTGQTRQGFALSIAYRIVKSHQGMISVEQSALGGTFYRIILPRTVQRGDSAAA